MPHLNIIFLLFFVISVKSEENMQKEIKLLRRMIEQQNEVIEDMKKESDKQREVNRQQDIKIDLLQKNLMEHEKVVNNLNGELKQQYRKQEILKAEAMAMRMKMKKQERDMDILRKNNFVNHRMPVNEINPSNFQRPFSNSSKTYQLERKEIRTGRRSSRSSDDVSVAFYVYMSTTMTNIGGHHILVFDAVKLNIGNGYHPISGTFIVPIRGVYVFSWSVRVIDGSYHSLELVRNGYVVGAVYASAGNPASSTSATTIVIQVEEGDELFVRTKMDYNNGTIYSNRYGYTSFAGWKLN